MEDLIFNCPFGLKVSLLILEFYEHEFGNNEKSIMSIPKMLTCDTFPGFLSFCPSNFFPRFLQWPSLCVAPSIFCPVFFCGQGHVYCSPVVFGHVGVDVMAVALCSTLAFSGLHRDVPSRNPVSSFVSSFSSSFFSCL